MKFALVNAPFVPLYIPSTGVGIISAQASACGLQTRVCDLNNHMAEWLLNFAPQLESVWDRAHPDHLGQMLFSQMLFPGTLIKQAPDLERLFEIEFGLSLREAAHEADTLIDSWLLSHNIADFDIVGLSVMNHQLLPVIFLLQKIKRLNPDAITIIGGFYVSSQNGVAMMHKVPEIDFAVFGEGEETFRDLINCIQNDNPKNNVRGLIYRDGAGQVVANTARENLTNEELDALPLPDYSWIKPSSVKRYDISIPVLSIRGCYWGHCTFCSDFQFNRQWRSRSAEQVVTEIRKQAEQYNINRFYFSDLATNDDIERVVKISEGIAEMERDIDFRVLFIPDNIDLNMLKKLKRAGCSTVQYGIESLSNDHVKRMAKAQRMIDSARCISLTEQAGMRAVSNLLRNFPLETLEHIIDNYEALRKYPELFNGYVFGETVVPFRLRSGSFLQSMEEAKGWKRTARSINSRFWPTDWDEAIPDIEWLLDAHFSCVPERDRLWNKVERLLQINKQHRKNTLYIDDGHTLKMRKYNCDQRCDIEYSLTGHSRAVYHAISDLQRIDDLPSLTGLDQNIIIAILEYFEAEYLVCSDGSRVIGTVHPLVSEFLPVADSEVTVDQEVVETPG